MRKHSKALGNQKNNSCLWTCPDCGQKHPWVGIDLVQCECGFPGKTKKKNKYRSEKIEVDGIIFDSRKEANRYSDLKLMQAAGEISDLELQVVFDLGVCKYIADFRYKEDGNVIVEDVKSKPTRTRVYMLKRKLMKERFGIVIKEV